MIGERELVSHRKGLREAMLMRQRAVSDFSWQQHSARIESILSRLGSAGYDREDEIALAEDTISAGGA